MYELSKTCIGDIDNYGTKQFGEKYLQLLSLIIFIIVKCDFSIIQISSIKWREIFLDDIDI